MTDARHHSLPHSRRAPGRCAGPLALSAGPPVHRAWGVFLPCRKRARTGHAAPAMPFAAALHRCPTRQGQGRARRRKARATTNHHTAQPRHRTGTARRRAVNAQSFETCMHARGSAARLPCGSLVERPHRSACGSRRQCASGRSAGSSLRSASPQAAVVARFASTRPGGRHRPHLLGTALAC